MALQLFDVSKSCNAISLSYLYASACKLNNSVFHRQAFSYSE